MRSSSLPIIALIALAGLAGCTRTKDVLEPSAIAPPENPVVAGTAAGAGAPAAPMPPMPGSAPAPTAPTVSAPPIAGATLVKFDPIVGATVETAGPLTERLVARARERGIRIAGAAEPATRILKGYFSASTEGAETSIIYVWDVYDPAGLRLHRISGQYKAPSQGRDGWASVSAQTMQAVADQSAGQLFALFASPSG